MSIALSRSIAAARVGGISANNTRPADFIWDNLVIEANLIKAAHDNDVQRLLFLGSSCIYPKFAKQPIREDSLLTGVLSPLTSPTPLPKSPGSSSVRASTGNLGETTAASCRPICTVLETISILNTLM